jgi:hypothetical protein
VVHRPALTDFYATHNPDRLNEVPSILLKYLGHEEELFQRLRKKYTRRKERQREEEEVEARMRGEGGGGGGGGRGGGGGGGGGGASADARLLSEGLGGVGDDDEDEGKGGEESDDRDVLLQLFRSCGGLRWSCSGQWPVAAAAAAAAASGGSGGDPSAEATALLEQPLGAWCGVTVEALQRVVLTDSLPGDGGLNACWHNGLDVQMVTVLRLPRNGLEGRLPEALFTLQGCREMDLCGNELVGCIPERVGECKSLQVLDLSSNQLEGALPAAVGRCSQLRTLALAHNRLSGQLPDTVGDLRSLQELSAQVGVRLTVAVPYPGL